MINVPEGPGTKRRDVRKGRESPEAWPGGAWAGSRVWGAVQGWLQPSGEGQELGP